MAEVISDDTVFVAVGKDVEESKLTLLWLLQNLEAKNVCLLHVRQPINMISSNGGNLSSGIFEQHEPIAVQEIEREKMHEILNDYLDICHQAGMNAREVHIEMDDVGEGIVELIYRHTVKKLVMGAAADKHYSQGMTDLKSKKAKYVHQHVPLSCHIWFICQGHLIHTGEGDFDRFDVEVRSSSSQASSITETGSSNSSSPSPGFCVQVPVPVPDEITEGDENKLELLLLPLREEEDHYLPGSGIQRGYGHDQIYEKLEEAMVEAEKSKREALEESTKRYKAEKSAIEAIRGARELESMYAEELRRRKETEEALAKEKEELEMFKRQRDEDRLISLDQKSLMESQVASTDYIIKELNDKIASDQELLRICNEDRDNLQVERDNLLKVTEDLLKKQTEEASSMHMDQFISEFSVSEIQEATCNFDPSLKIAEGGNGSIYKGSLHHTLVAIKVLHPNSLQGPSEFQQEVNVLSKLRHPNLVTFIGICPEIRALIFEYLPNGSLEDRLNCKDNTPPLSWQTRIRIAIELCSVLIFLHSSSPHGIVHGDLNPGNILLDANFVCKLSDFGFCHALSSRENLRNHRTDPNGSLAYIDPQSVAVGEPSPKSDVYSFGIILLQLLIGTPPLSMMNGMQDAIDEGNLNAILDPSAGDWPLVQAEQWAHLAFRCCEINCNSRPDLVPEVWSVLELVRASCGASSSPSHSPSPSPSSSFQPGSEEQCQPPSYFVCPILQEIMREPHVAADGFTYEAEALNDWLESGHDTSPMTNLQLAHRNLVPNLSLRSAIQEWLQLH